MRPEPKAGKQRARTFVLALASCLALAVAFASTAAALSIKPDYPESPIFPLGFSVSGGWAQMSGLPYANISCKSSTTGSGSIEDEASGVIWLEFHECVRWSNGWPSCQTSGAGNGNIVTEPLEAKLAELPNGHPGAVLEPINPQNVFATFECGGYVHETWKGGLIGEISEPGFDVRSNTMSIDFNVPESGQQEFTRTKDGSEARLYSLIGSEKDYFAMSVDLQLRYAEGAEPDLSQDEPGPPTGEGHPYLVASGGFPAPAKLSSEEVVTLRPSGSGWVVTCTTSGGVPAVSGSGEFSNSNSGEMDFTLHHCKEGSFNSDCTTPGQSKGTVTTGALPVRLTDLADGSPGISVGAGAAFVEMECLSGLVGIAVSGDVLGAVTSEADKFLSSLGFDMNIVGAGEEHEQEYVETADGEAQELTASVNRGKATAELLDMQGGLQLEESPRFILRE